MNPLPTPIQTPKATAWLMGSDARSDRVRRALLASVDGRRNLVELESLARALGLAPDALEKLGHDGLVVLDGRAQQSEPR